MPKIIGQEEQQRALKQITALLKEVSAVNAFLSAENPEGEFVISFTDNNKAKHSCSIFSEDRKAVDQLALNYKNRIKAQILELANEHRIALDHSEQAILDNDRYPEPSVSPESAS